MGLVCRWAKGWHGHDGPKCPFLCCMTRWLWMSEDLQSSGCGTPVVSSPYSAGSGISTHASIKPLQSCLRWFLSPTWLPLIRDTWLCWDLLWPGLSCVLTCLSLPLPFLLSILHLILYPVQLFGFSVVPLYLLSIVNIVTRFGAGYLRLWCREMSFIHTTQIAVNHIVGSIKWYSLETLYAHTWCMLTGLWFLILLSPSQIKFCITRINKQCEDIIYVCYKGVDHDWHCPDEWVEVRVWILSQNHRPIKGHVATFYSCPAWSGGGRYNFII